MKIQKDFSGLRKLEKSLAKLSREKIEYGFFGDVFYPDGDNTAEIAIINEYGSTENPTRPFFEKSRSILQNEQNPVKPLIEKEVVSAIFGKPGTQLDNIAELLIAGVQGQIEEWDTPGNSPKTIRRKGKDDPLMDTELMKDSVHSRIERG